MKAWSLALFPESTHLQPVEVEVSLCPGLPQIYFLGLADKSIKESTYRIKSALKHQGFPFPRAQKILVNLRPGNLKKSSLGLELAVALILLWKMGYKIPPKIQRKWCPQGKDKLQEREHRIFIYGELGLHGEVFAPNDLKSFLDFPTKSLVYTGEGKEQYPFNCKRITCLKDMDKSRWQSGLKPSVQVERPSFGVTNLYYSPQQAQQIAMIALGEHSSLFLGPAGSGKSTIAQAIHTFISPPNPLKTLTIQNLSGQKKEKVWRPLIQTHQSSTSASLLGGGNPPRKGDISRAHGGTLILDEFLLFTCTAQEALHLPMEKDLIYLSRGGKRLAFPCQVLVLATSTLCPCGKYHPFHQKRLCSYTLARCRSYRNRLSSSLLDRFALIILTHSWQKEEKNLSGQELLEKIERAQTFSQKRNGNKTIKPNSRLSLKELQFYIRPILWKNALPETSSQRRLLFVLQVARSLADLEASEEIQAIHLSKAIKHSLLPCQKLEMN